MNINKDIKYNKNIKKGDSNNSLYIPVKIKFLLGHTLALAWMLFSIYISIPWINDLSKIIPRGFAVAIIAGIGYIPGYINAFNVVSLLLDRQPKFKTLDQSIGEVLSYIKKQDYQGRLRLLLSTTLRQI